MRISAPDAPSVAAVVQVAALLKQGARTTIDQGDGAPAGGRTLYASRAMTPTPIALGPDTLQRQFTLPPLPEVAAKLLDTMSSDLTTARDVGELIGADPGLAADVLKIVNSACYGLAREIRDVTTTVAYLGLAKISQIVMVSSVMQVIAPSEVAERRAFWFHSYDTALVAKRVARQVVDAPEPEELYAAGLLHDIGKMVWLKLFPEQHRELTAFAATQGRFLVDDERHFGQPSHLTFGVMLCDRWRLPTSIRHVCEAHELDQLRDGACGSPVQRVIALANLLAQLNGSTPDPAVNEEIRKQVQDTLRCSEQDFLLLMGEVYELEQEVGRFLSQL